MTSKDADLIIEAVYEELGVKESVFKQIDAIARPGAILANGLHTRCRQVARSTSTGRRRHAFLQPGQRDETARSHAARRLRRCAGDGDGVAGAIRKTAVVSQVSATALSAAA
ncbi:MAG: 3-hydroxyacyl-CoA dehydrogenase NAD-binding domain-containing protein [Dokdonella sp.]